MIVSDDNNNHDYSNMYLSIIQSLNALTSEY